MSPVLNNEMHNLATSFCAQYAHCSDCPVAVSPEGCPVEVYKRFHPQELATAAELLLNWAKETHVSHSENV